jgi:LPS-assembly lipoprotein
MKIGSFTAICILGLLAGACGFHPLYGSGPRGSIDDTFGAIYVDPVTDNRVGNTGYELRNTLIDVLDANRESPSYHLSLTLGVVSEGSALQNNAAITRYNDKLTVGYVLTDGAGKIVTKGVETSFSAYNVVTSPYATLAEQQDADTRAAQDIAERIRIALGVYFHQHATLAQ